MSKIINFFEEHIEKIILAIIGLVCIWFLITRVLLSPNVVSYDGRKFSPGGIDPFINEQAELLRQKLGEPPKQPEPYKPRFGEFLALVDSALRDIDVSHLRLRPYNSGPGAGAKRAYHLPQIGEISDVAAEHIRAVAYLPTEEINEQIVYDQAAHEPNDIDFVTVEGTFDVVGLYQRFRESFVGEDVKQEWRDPCLAKPVFAAVQLQKQELNGDGSWSDWQIVPRTRIDHHKQLFEVIEAIEELPPGGLKVRMLQFNEKQVQIDLLQPQAYRIASAKEEWFTPALHKKFLDLQRKEELEARREAMEAERQQREQERQEEREGRLGRRGPGARLGGGRTGGMYDGYEGMDGVLGGRSGSRVGTRRTRSDRDRRYGGTTGTSGRRYNSRERSGRTRRPGERDDIERPGIRREISRQPSIRDVYDEFNQILITRRTDIAKMRESLAFWAHDDTVEPEKSYRYRIRIGVFNPIAGTNQFSEQDSSLKSQVILWSEFSDTTETVEIPGTLYFFAKDIQEAAKKVTVTVCKYELGYWYSEDFAVNQGEVIGKVVETEPVEAKSVVSSRLTYSRPEDSVTEPETIDYGTGAVLVDATLVNDWTGVRNLSPRNYYDMLYSFDGTNIEHMPIKTRNWPEEMLVKFNNIKKSQKQTKEPLRAWGGRLEGRRRRATDMDIYELDEMDGMEVEDYYDLYIED